MYIRKQTATYIPSEQMVSGSAGEYVYNEDDFLPADYPQTSVQTGYAAPPEYSQYTQPQKEVRPSIPRSLKEANAQLAKSRALKAANARLSVAKANDPVQPPAYKPEVVAQMPVGARVQRPPAYNPVRLTKSSFEDRVKALREIQSQMVATPQSGVFDMETPVHDLEFDNFKDDIPCYFDFVHGGGAKALKGRISFDLFSPSAGTSTKILKRPLGVSTKFCIGLADLVIKIGDESTFPDGDVFHHIAASDEDPRFTSAEVNQSDTCYTMLLYMVCRWLASKGMFTRFGMNREFTFFYNTDESLCSADIFINAAIRHGLRDFGEVLRTEIYNIRGRVPAKLIAGGEDAMSPSIPPGYYSEADVRHLLASKEEEMRNYLESRFSGLRSEVQHGFQRAMDLLMDEIRKQDELTLKNGGMNSVGASVMSSVKFTGVPTCGYASRQFQDINELPYPTIHIENAHSKASILKMYKEIVCKQFLVPPPRPSAPPLAALELKDFDWSTFDKVRVECADKLYAQICRTDGDDSITFNGNEYCFNTVFNEGPTHLYGLLSFISDSDEFNGKIDTKPGVLTLKSMDQKQFETLEEIVTVYSYAHVLDVDYDNVIDFMVLWGFLVRKSDKKVIPYDFFLTGVDSLVDRAAKLNINNDCIEELSTLMKKCGLDA